MTNHSDDIRTRLPIERGFPIERVNEIAAKEGRAKQYYRPIYTMHKWWARRLGVVFRSIALYSLLDDPEKVTVLEPGDGYNESLQNYGDGIDVERLIEDVDLSDPESLWELYPKDVRVEDKKILDPFMGGGTSLVEASRFGVESVGYDLNPVAWFVTKKELEAGQTDIDELEAAFEQVEADVADDITQYYRTPCPNAQTYEDEPLDEDPLELNTDFDYEIPQNFREDIDSHDHYADVMYNFWVKEIECVDCGSTVPLFKDYRVAKGRYENKDKYNVLCPECESVVLVDDWQSESTCPDCNNEWVPAEGTVSGSKYACPDCGSQYAITDAIQEQGGFDLRLYAVEYYCPTCEERSLEKSEVKGYKGAQDFDEALYDASEQEWNQKEELHEYVPEEEVPEGHMTTERNPVFDHGYTMWKDMFNTRQLLALSKLLSSMDDINDRNLSEFLLLALSESLNYNSMMNVYNPAYNKNTNIFKSNSFDPPVNPLENNVWGTEFGTGTFSKMWDMILKGIEYAKEPTDRYVENGNTIETHPFGQPIGENATVYQGDMRTIDAENEYDAVITDPPYYDNIMYSEVADYFYVWQKILLEDEYDCFQHEKTPRAESIVTNPYFDKTAEDFESDLHEALTVVHRALKDNGVLAFTYHHSDSKSWGELLEALCDVGFEVTATYPISADINKFITGEAVEFDIVIVARPAEKREAISWDELRRNIYRTAQRTRQRLEENRDLSKGDIGVVEMGRAFHEYSKHHRKVRKGGDTMTAKEVVDEIYGIIQEASQIGIVDVFLGLLEMADPSYDDLDKECRSANTTPEEFDDMNLYRMNDGFTLGTWDDEYRQSYIRQRVESGEELTPLDKMQFLRYRYEHGKSIQEYVDHWRDDDLQELAERLADVSRDEVYRRVLGNRDITSY